jgi:hypothetical protein
MVTGIGFVALLTASIAHRFVAHAASEQHAQISREEEILQEIRGLHDRLDRFERHPLDRTPESDEQAA